MRDRIGDWWNERLQADGLVVAAREVHELYESEGRPDEAFLGATRYTRREGKAAIVEQRLVETDTGRSVARAWVVQLLVRGGRVVAWPAEYFARVEEVEGRPVAEGGRRAVVAWGPPE